MAPDLPTPPSPPPPPRLQLPTRLSEQVPGLAEYQPRTGAPSAGRAIQITDRDAKETRKVRTILASVGLFVAVIVGAVILAGSHSQPGPEERLAWNKAEIALLQRCLFRATPARYQQVRAGNIAGGDPALAVRALLIEELRKEQARLEKFLNSIAGQSDAQRWESTRREKQIAVRALAWIDGYDRPFDVQVNGLRLTVNSWGANGHADTEADLPKDDLTASVLMSSGEPMQVKKWEEVFTLPDMSQVQSFDPGDPKSMERLRALDPEHLTPRERLLERKHTILNLMDEGFFGDDLQRKLQEFELRHGIPQVGDTQKRTPVTGVENEPSTSGRPVPAQPLPSK